MKLPTVTQVCDTVRSFIGFFTMEFISLLSLKK